LHLSSSCLRASPHPPLKIVKSERARAAILDAGLKFIWSRPFGDITMTHKIIGSACIMLERQFNRLEALPNLIAETRKQSEAAEKNATLLAEDHKSAKTETEKILIDIKLENAQLEKQIALKFIKILRVGRRTFPFGEK
jgi:hypothetical protein